MTKSGFNPAKIQVFVYILIAVIVLFVMYQLMKRIGLIRSKEQRKRDKLKQESKTEKKFIETAIETDDVFNPNTWKNVFSKERLLTENEAKEQAKEIWKAWGWPFDDEERVYAAFRSLSDPIQVSQVAYWYMDKYNEDLATGLTKRLDKKELVTVHNIIKNIK